ncbi:hypothetical protein EYE40_12805 [Glaciihabitans arcticus]|uniref:NTP pyrophosphohydrolase n=1 Tax=Glaciihabitans arcticus TaxID=2668039 RepID=A0A4V2JF58_9MICO|nr:hypothetical protein [Glaciihabitans arcticus]TBN58199.1 hypothetical protein EYE40_12805 [Glaciihabitans arcticus]
MTEHFDGRVSISARALERTVTAIAASRLGVAASEVNVRLTDDSGLLAVAVAAPIGIPPLRSTNPGRALPERIVDARSQIRDDVTRIAGATVGTVALTITRARMLEERRVR